MKPEADTKKSGEKAKLKKRTRAKHSGVTRLPNRTVYALAMGVLRPRTNNKCNVRITRRGLEDIKPPYVVLSNHCSRQDWIYVGMALWPALLNVVVTRYHYSNPKLRPLLEQAGAIQKDQFSPDLAAIKSIMSVIKRGGNIMLFPEGRTSAAGTSETFERSTIKLLKHLGVPVIGMHMDGSYFTMPKWNAENRTGRVDITVEPLFTAEEVSEMDADDMYDRMCARLWSDEYAWQRKNRVAFHSKNGIALGLEGVLYMCPRCGAEMTTVTGRDYIRCESCGNGAHLNEYYDLIPFDDDCVIPEDIGAWYQYEVDKERERIAADEDLEMTGHVTLNQIQDKHRWLAPVGTGDLKLNKDGVFFSGTRNDEPFELHIPLAAIPAIAYGPCESFEIYYNKEMFSFVPDQIQTCQKWSILGEQMHNYHIKRTKPAR